MTEEAPTSLGIHNRTVQPSYSISQSGTTLEVKAFGSWNVNTISQIADDYITAIQQPHYEDVEYDFTDLSDLDTSGANILARAVNCNDTECYPFRVNGGSKGDASLMRMAADAVFSSPPPQPVRWDDSLVRLGKATEKAMYEVYDTVAFLGKFVTVLFHLILRPRQIRWKSVVAQIEDVGINASPIIMVLSFFIGAVIAYMGASLLSAFGAQIYMVDLITVAVFREFGVLIMAIMLAGRSDSAFTAQIGSMKMRQEIDAMTVIGLDTFESLVIPRALACLVSAPALTFLAIMAGIGGGMLVAWVGNTDISPILFVTRMQDVISARHFWVGMVKAPVFGLIIAMIGCRQGLAVKGSVESLGQRTTTSVVQAIFTVITVDAVFAIIFYQMGI